MNRRFFRRLHFLRRRAELDRELAEEIEFHRAMKQQENENRGLAPAEANQAAQRQMGNLTQAKECSRDFWSFPLLEKVWQDVRCGIRTLCKTPSFTIVAVLVLGLGIGAPAAMFSLVDAFLLKPLAIAKPGELFGLYSRDTKQPGVYRGFSYPNYVDIRDNNSVFASLMAHTMTMVGLKEGDNTRRAFADFVSSNYFATLGVPLLKGRPFKPGEEEPGSGSTVILSYPYWIKAGADPRILGEHLWVDGHSFTVVGVTPEGFTGTTALVSPEIFLPLGAYAMGANDSESNSQPLALRNNNALIVAGRLKPGISLQQADAMLAVLASRMGKAFPADDKDQALFLHPLSRLSITTNPTDDNAMRLPAVLLMSLAGAVLLIACLNLANMMMARGAVRRKEIAIRLAIGGTRRRILQQLMTEGLILACIGGLAGLLIASGGTTLLIGSMSHVMPLELVYKSVPDAGVLVATLVFCVLATVVFGLFPSLRLSKPDTWSDLKEIAARPTSGTNLRIFSRGNGLVIAQLSLSLMMLTGVGLFVHSALRATNIRPGFSMDNQVLAEVDPGLINYDEAHARQLYNAVRNRLATVPNVRSVAIAATVPFGMKHMAKRVTPAEVIPSAGHPPLIARFNIVTKNYFQTLDIPLLRGRSFTDLEDLPGSKNRSAMIDQLAAEKLWPRQSPLGKRIRLSDGSGHGEICEVVGIVGNIRESILSRDMQPHVYIPFGQQYQPDMYIHLKIAGAGPESATSTLATIRREIHAADARLPLLSLTTMRAHLESGIEVWVIRSGAYVMGIFGAVALFLAMISLYAVNAYTVARRTREIGIRMALGADPSSTLRMILGDGVRVILAGFGIGVLLAIGLGQILAGFLYGVRALDAAVLLASSVMLISVALLACYLPARRASRIEPMIALREE